MLDSCKQDRDCIANKSRDVTNLKSHLINAVRTLLATLCRIRCILNVKIIYCVMFDITEFDAVHSCNTTIYNYCPSPKLSCILIPTI